MTREGKERRRHPRYRARIKVRLWDEGVESLGHTADVSNRGAFIETNKALERGTQLHLEFFLPGRSHFGECVVARRRKVPAAVQPVTRPGLGVRFVGADAVVRAVVSASQKPDYLVELTSPQAIHQALAGELMRGGLFVPTEMTPEAGSTAVVRIALPEPHAEIEVKGTVVHLSQSPPGFGMQLHEKEKVLLELTRLLDTVGR